MDPVTLAGTALRVSRLCYGNMTFGSQTGAAEGQRIIDACLANGINFIDTANVYNKGAAEEMLGRILKGRRGQVVLATKVRGVMGPGPDESGLSRQAMLKAIDDSLRRLQTDHVDLYYLHQPDYTVPIEETLATMDELVTLGKVRYPAVSNYAAWQVAKMRMISGKGGWKPMLAAQMMHNLVARGLEQEFVPFAKEFGVSLVVYNPLAGGLLTGKQQREAPLPGTRFDNNQMYLDRYWHPAFFDAVDQLSGIAQRAGRSLISMAFNWLLHHTSTACVILGSSRLEQLEQNLKACEEGPLTPDVVAECDRVWAGLRGVTPKYNR
ncbi:MAG: aldo/keto reductase [Acidobacteria bacterium]|nr:aldo/keto reductase [Acidobacteriota bacterium]